MPSSRTRARDAIAMLADAIEIVLNDHPQGLDSTERWIQPFTGA